jgi:hypothetical protein
MELDIRTRILKNDIFPTALAMFLTTNTNEPSAISNIRRSSWKPDQYVEYDKVDQKFILVHVGRSKETEVRKPYRPHPSDLTAKDWEYYYLPF